MGGDEKRVTPSFTHRDVASATKGAVHGALGALAVLCCGYNVAAWWHRRERHLAVNAVVYGALIAFEVGQVIRHAKKE